MRQNFKPYTSLKCRGFFCNIEPISRSNYGVLSPALLNDHVSNSIANLSATTGSSPSLSHIPKRSLHHILHYLTLELIKKSKQPSSSSFSQKRHRYFLFQYHKNFQLICRLKGNALCLLQTQYAKKPKNPE
jgi:hypothetical protein